MSPRWRDRGQAERGSQSTADSICSDDFISSTVPAGSTGLVEYCGCGVVICLRSCCSLFFTSTRSRFTSRHSDTIQYVLAIFAKARNEYISMQRVACIINLSGYSRTELQYMRRVLI
jgi:hypothetical protein